MKPFLHSIFILLFLVSCNIDEPTEFRKPQKSLWIKHAFHALKSNSYPRIKAISWWHENFDNSYLKVNTSRESLDAYREGVSSDFFVTSAVFESNKLVAPDYGMYHSAFPDFGGTEDDVSAKKITDFENLVNKKIVWAYFSNNWCDSIKFPTEEVNTILSAGRIPFIRIMARTNFEEGGPDPNYTMQKIIDGVYDSALIQWAIDAANTNTPLLAEFGTEVNGSWFPWNGLYNGGENTMGYGNYDLPDGPERFIDAYRHIIDICRQNGATNITWFFHVNADDEPAALWNKFENYYPGDEYIDWIGVSIYGPQVNDEEYQELSDILNNCYYRLCSLSQDKPIAILEFAVTEFY